jgi:hypothetical protein
MADQGLPLNEHETRRVSVEPAQTWADRTAGMLQWTGDPEVLERIATDPEYGILEAAGIIGWTGSDDELRYFALDPDLDPEESA